MALMIIIGKKGTKKPIGVIRTKINNKKKLVSAIRSNLRKGLTFKVVDSKNLKRLTKPKNVRLRRKKKRR